VLDPAGTAGAALYVLGHAGVKGALFLLAGIVLNRYGSVDERRLHGRGRTARWMPWLWLLAGLALAGLPPFGTGLGKAVGEEALGTAGLPFGAVLFIGVSALTGGAVLRAGARVYRGLGAPPHEAPGPGTADADREQPAGSRVRIAMLGPAVVLLAAGLAVGAVPAVGRAVAAAAAGLLDRQGYVAAALGGTAGPPPPVPEAGWTTSGLLLGLMSAGLAVGVAAAALWAPRLPRPFGAVGRAGAPLVAGLRRVHSGRIGDYVAWLFLGTAVFAGLVALPLA
jgi:multicomponent Na+:H+ antiporter subunit D